MSFVEMMRGISISRIEESSPRIEALGITDYWSIERYEEVRAYRDGGRLPDVALIFPNIEMRFGIGTAGGSAINAHLLVSPEDPEHVALTRQFLANLEFGMRGETYRCTYDDLMRLGRAHDPSVGSDDRRALAVGANQFKITVDGLRNAFDGPGEGTAVEILAVPSLRRVAEIPMRSAGWSAFSDDGRLLILGDHEGRAQIYDGHTFKPRGRPLLGHTGFILTEDFSPDGRTVATSSSDGTVRLWDVASGRPIGSPLPGIPNAQVGAVFTRGGTHIAAVYESGQGFSWDIRPSSWARRACEIAGRH